MNNQQPTSAKAAFMHQGQARQPAPKPTSAKAAFMHHGQERQPVPKPTNAKAAFMRNPPSKVVQPDALRVARPDNRFWLKRVFLIPRIPGSFKPRIIGRAGWKAAPPNVANGYERVGGDYHSAYNTIVIHHSGNRNNYPTMRQAQDEEMRKGYADIAYHFGVDIKGSIYAGRPLWIKGAHVKGLNTGKIGVVLLTDLDTENSGLNLFEKLAENLNGDGYVSGAMYSSLVNLVLYLRNEYCITFLGGHKEVLNERNCPGNLGLELVEKLRRTYHFQRPTSGI